MKHLAICGFLLLVIGVFAGIFGGRYLEPLHYFSVDLKSPKSDTLCFAVKENGGKHTVLYLRDCDTGNILAEGFVDSGQCRFKIDQTVLSRLPDYSQFHRLAICRYDRLINNWYNPQPSITGI